MRPAVERDANSENNSYVIREWRSIKSTEKIESFDNDIDLIIPVGGEIARNGTQKTKNFRKNRRQDKKIYVWRRLLNVKRNERSTTEDKKFL